ncbi:TetR/AcrR family transcriptional regulator [Nocardioides campestrisoli]|uniref:TetR/AcrR family transcriptional regulator n=1 Tax=Nocardioides campestrisoli TaxID=2736757 RepID=UPI0028124BEF|nr:helix-turn-helix domain-containing protein [Nocardioides campestrisoli]
MPPGPPEDKRDQPSAQIPPRRPARQPQPREHNRGPAAAAQNRAAILRAARRLFAERGYHVPLNAIAREAGVGQGVLYRHFPGRHDLAFAVFEENFAELEEVAQGTDAQVFERLLSTLVELIVGSAAFVEMVVDARRSLPTYDGDERLRRLLERALATSQAAGAVTPELTADDVLLAVRMVYGVVATAPDAESARLGVAQARRLLGDWA